MRLKIQVLVLDSPKNEMWTLEHLEVKVQLHESHNKSLSNTFFFFREFRATFDIYNVWGVFE